MLEGIGKIARNGHLTIPVKIRKLLHIHDGDVVKIWVEGHKIMVRPGTVIDKDQEYFSGKECQKEIKMSEKEFKKGRFSSYSSVKELRKELESD